MSDTVTATPVALRVATAVLFVETAGAAIAAALLAFEAATRHAVSAASGISSVVTLALVAVLLGALGRFLLRRAGGARGPALVLQILFVPVGWYMVTGGVPLLGIPLMVIAVIGAAALLAPTTRVALGIGLDRNEPGS